LKNVLCDGERAMGFDWIKRVRFIKGTATALAYMHHDCIPSNSSHGTYRATIFWLDSRI
ncbi:hypothetical protein MKW92_016476, partial [Papaver armeniacum]